MNAAGRSLAALALVAMLAGCRTVVTYSPGAPTAPDAAPLSGQIDYDGNPDFLPKMLARTDAAASDLHFRYRSNVSYRHTSGAQLFNPLLLFGFRGVGMNVTATANLAISRGDETATHYDATCVVKMRRSVWIWGHPTQSELRRRALMAVRDMIDQELVRDRDDWVSALVGERSGHTAIHHRRKAA